MHVKKDLIFVDIGSLSSKITSDFSFHIELL